jgi:hypothetical protein
MAKKLVYNYTFDASAQQVILDGYHPLRVIQLITNVTDNVIIYNFSDSAKGGTVTYDNNTEKTTITLTYNTTSMSDTDELQIFIDTQENKIDASESLLDPVHKFRVSNPENLIDTDFEYGLQPTKWETVELVNNIPSVYASGSGVSLDNISSINTTSNTEIINVICTGPHGLSVGDPIEVRGTKSQTANGKYIITSVESTSRFSYRAGSTQQSSENIKTAYSVIIPGAFFSSSNIQYDFNEGIETNNASPSTLTITTEQPHGFSTSTSLYITNTVGKKTITIPNPGSNAADGSKFISTSTDTPDSTIYGLSHGFYNNQTLFISSSGSLPNTATAAPEPNGITGESDIEAVYNAVVGSTQTFKTTMGSDHNRILINYFDNSTYARYFAGGSIDNSYQDANYGHYFGSSSYYAQFNTTLTNGTNITRYRWYNYGEGTNTLYTGSPVDIGAFYTRNYLRNGYGSAPSTLANTGLYMISTPHAYNSAEDAIVTIRSYPSPASINSYSQSTYTYDDSWRSQYTNAWYIYYNSRVQTSNTRTSIGDGWYYTWHGCFYDDSYSNNRSQFMKIDLMIENDNWSGQYGGNSSWQNPRIRYEYSLGSYDTTLRGSHYHVEVLMAVKDIVNGSGYGPSGSTLSFSTMASTIANDIKSALSAAQFTAGINTVKASIVDNNRFRIKNLNDVTYSFESSGTGTITVQTGQTSGVVDDYYNITGVTTNTIGMDVGLQISPRVLEFDNGDVVEDSSNYYIYFADGHGLSDGQKVVHNVTSGSAVPGISNATTYYAITTNQNYLQLASSVDNWRASINEITGVQGSTGAYNLTVSSISGRVAAAGTITTSENSKVVTGTDTRFTSTYSVGDPFIITGVGTYAGYITGEIASITNDSSLTLTDNVGVGLTGENHFIDTKVNVRADGEFLHRPFDGGVDITAGTSADSKIIRQTRKYFRYQSGKGIQCSMAINFNPYRPARTLTSSSNIATVTTEVPHGLVSGNSIKVRGAEILSSYSPSTATYDSSTGILTITISNHGFVVGEEVSLAENSFTFTCAKDSHASNHTYPRSTDPAGQNTRLPILSVTTNTFTVDVGTSTYVGAHTIVSISSNAVTHYDISNPYNGTFDVTSSTDFSFTYTMGSTPSTTSPTGFFEYTISSYTNAAIRAGLFDDQNGMYYEYDGKSIHCVRRSSTQQLAGTSNVVYGSNTVIGTNTRFSSDLKLNDYVVIRGQSYKVVNIDSDTEIIVQPRYKGKSNTGVVITKTEDVRVKQSNWNIDRADGTGPSGYNLDINAIQMAYMDYSWYGAGKIRFGFKDRLGHVKYMHEFLHNNRLNEAYMRTGNVPARYEVVNKGIPTFVPSLFHWGTSVIMDGGFDDDDSYLFTASGNTLTFTNGDSDSAITNDAATLYSTSGWGNPYHYLNIPFNSTDSSKFTSGVPLYTEDLELNGDTVSYTTISGSTVNVRVYLQRSRNPPAVYPNVGAGTTVNIGAPSSGAASADLTSQIPLVSLRLAPSCDNNLIGSVGERDIINRMQLKLRELGVSVSHDCRISVILNGRLSNLTYDNVGAPSLSQYIAHTAGDEISDGITIYQFRASGGDIGSSGERTVASQTFDLSKLIDLGNSILGGDGVFPDGPDIITIAATVLDTTSVNQDSPFQVSSRISWAESQA